MPEIISFALMLCSLNSFATGMVPETSILLVDAQKGEASMNVTNTDSFPVLLYSNIVELPDGDKSVRLIVSQPVVRGSGLCSACALCSRRKHR